MMHMARYFKRNKWGLFCIPARRLCVLNDADIYGGSFKVEMKRLYIYTYMRLNNLHAGTSKTTRKSTLCVTYLVPLESPVSRSRLSC